MNQRLELIEFRKKSNLTQDDIAGLLKISRAYYTNIEVGRKNPSMAVAKKIADVLNTTVDAIFFNVDVPKRNETA
jgi:DNA-binding XRE family transcriptional regulator